MMNINEFWCSICCTHMSEGCRKCSHFDEQVHLNQEDKVDTSPEHLPDAEHARNNLLMECCMNNPELYNRIGNIIYRLYGEPMGAELTMLVTYVCRELRNEERKVKKNDLR